MIQTYFNMIKFLVIFLLFPFLVSGQAISQQFENMQFIYKVADSIYIEEVPDVNVSFMWTNTDIRMDVYSDTGDSTRPIIVLGGEVSVDWRVGLDGGFFVFDNYIQEGLLYRLWFDRDRNVIVRIVAINSLNETAIMVE